MSKLAIAQLEKRIDCLTAVALMQAVCAIMRMLLHAIHGMLKHNEPFDNTRYYAIPEYNG